MTDVDDRWDAPLTQEQWKASAWMFDNYETAVKRIVDAAPPLSDAQRDKLATLLREDR